VGIEFDTGSCVFGVRFIDQERDAMGADDEDEVL
jgi:hypothetical protein